MNTKLYYNRHDNELGDYCPWSSKPVQAEDDECCPARCPASEVLDETDWLFDRL